MSELEFDGSWSRGEAVAHDGLTTTFAHDGLGRVTARREHGPGGGLELGASWTWDPAANGLGRVGQASESVTGYQRTHGYDGLGRISYVATAYGGATHRERTTYDEFGRTFQTFDASRESASYADGGVRHVHNKWGHLSKLQDAVMSGSSPRTVYWESLEADASGRVVRERLGNGAERIRRHDGETGRLEALTATRPGQSSGDLQDFRMEWDLAGNLTKREDLTWQPGRGGVVHLRQAAPDEDQPSGDGLREPPVVQLRRVRQPSLEVRGGGLRPLRLAPEPARDGGQRQLHVRRGRKHADRRGADHGLRCGRAAEVGGQGQARRAVHARAGRGAHQAGGRGLVGRHGARGDHAVPGER